MRQRRRAPAAPVLNAQQSGCRCCPPGDTFPGAIAASDGESVVGRRACSVHQPVRRERVDSAAGNVAGGAAVADREHRHSVRAAASRFADAYARLHDCVARALAALLLAIIPFALGVAVAALAEATPGDAARAALPQWPAALPIDAGERLFW